MVIVVCAAARNNSREVRTIRSIIMTLRITTSHLLCSLSLGNGKGTSQTKATFSSGSAGSVVTHVAVIVIDFFQTLSRSVLVRC